MDIKKHRPALLLIAGIVALTALFIAITKPAKSAELNPDPAYALQQTRLVAKADTRCRAESSERASFDKEPGTLLKCVYYVMLSTIVSADEQIDIAGYVITYGHDGNKENGKVSIWLRGTTVFVEVPAG